MLCYYLDVRTELQGAPLTLTLPPLSYALLRRLDCRRALADVRRSNPSPSPSPSPDPSPNSGPDPRCGVTCSPRPRRGAVRSYVETRAHEGSARTRMAPSSAGGGPKQLIGSASLGQLAWRGEAVAGHTSLVRIGA